jgi:hypothetical protein
LTADSHSIWSIPTRPGRRRPRFGAGALRGKSSPLRGASSSGGHLLGLRPAAKFALGGRGGRARRHLLPTLARRGRARGGRIFHPRRSSPPSPTATSSIPAERHLLRSLGAREATALAGCARGIRKLLEGSSFSTTVLFSLFLSKREFADGDPVSCWRQSKGYARRSLEGELPTPPSSDCSRRNSNHPGISLHRPTPVNNNDCKIIPVYPLT